MEEKYVLGHKNPDTDSVVSAILYSDFLNSKGIKALPVVLGEINNETKFVLDNFGYTAPEIKDSFPENSEVILVDHNEKKQTIDNIDNLKIEEIIDHHKINFSYDIPIKIRCEPIGSTATVLAIMFKEEGYKLSLAQAGLLISAIISDTLFFKSPTTSEIDKKVLYELNEIANISDLDEFSSKLFDAKSDLGDISTEDMIKLDYKEFEFNGKKYGIGVMETTNPQSALDKRLEIIDNLKEIKKKDELSGILFSIIDIIKEENITIITDEHEKEILESVFNGEEIEHKTLSLGNLVSRKKQIVPYLEEYFNFNE